MPLDRKEFKCWITELIKNVKLATKNKEILEHLRVNYSNKMHNEIMFQNFSFSYKYILNSKSILDFGWGTVPNSSYLIRKINSRVSIHALETTVQNDSNYKKHESLNFIEGQKEIASHFKKFNVRFDFYKGKLLPYKDHSFDTVFAYAVIEHIPPVDRENVVKEIARVLTPNGYFLILRCPRYWSIAEFLAQRLRLGAHTWVLKRNAILNLVKSDFEIIRIKHMDSTFVYPTKITNPIFPFLMCVDRFFTLTRLNFWAHDYSIVLKKK